MILVQSVKRPKTTQEFLAFLEELKVLLNIQKTSETLFLFFLSYSTATIGSGRQWPREGESGQREGE